MLFPGIITAVVTPFTANDRIDERALAANVGFLVENGSDGIVATGTMGEAASLSDAERAHVVDVCAAAAGSAPVTVGVSAPTTAAACHYATIARAAGAHAVMCLPPLLYRGDERELAAHYKAVAQTAGLPVMAYNNPEASGTDLRPDVVARLVAAVPEIRGVKECSGDARRIAALLGSVPEVEVLVGGDDWALEGAAAGATGWVSGVSNVAPAECKALLELVAAGRLPEARELYQRLLPLARLDMTPKLVQYFKAALDLTGRYGGPVRAPRLPLTPAERGVVNAAVAALRPAVPA